MQSVNGGSAAARYPPRSEVSGIPHRRSHILVPLAAMVILAVVGWVGIGSKSLTLDEIATLRYVRQPIDGLWATIAEGQANQGLYYLAMVPWVALRETETWLRIPSLVAAILTVPALYRVGSLTVGATAAGIGVALFASSALVVQYAQNARAYTLVTLAVVLATWAFLRARERPTVTRLLVYALLVTASGYLHFFAGFVVLAHLLVLVVERDRTPWPRFGAVYAVVAILVAPLAIFMATQDTGQVDWVDAVSPDGLVTVLVAVAGGTIPVAIFTLLGIGLGLLAWRRDPSIGTTMVVAWAIAPILATIVISFVKPLLVPRYLIVAVPGIVLLVGAGIARLPRPASAGLLMAGLLVSGLALMAWYERPAPAWREASRYMLVASGPSDIVLYDVPYSRPAVEFYAIAFDAVTRLPRPVGYEDLDRHTGRPLWVVVHLLDEDQRLALDRRLAGDWTLSRSFGFDGISLRRYLPRPDG